MECGEYQNGRYDTKSFRHFNVCINTASSETYFVYHTLEPKVKAPPNYKRKTTWSHKLYRDNGEDAYDFDYQRERFSAFPDLGKTNCFLFVHFHLAPVVDFDTEQGRDETFHVENAVPGLQKVNISNWAAVENMVRKSIKNLVQIITGQFGQMALKNNFQKTKYLTLQRRIVEERGNRRKPERYHNIKVPAFFYKIVRDTITTEAYVIITSNNPFMEKLDVGSKMCADNRLCSSKQKENFIKFSKGYTYCCPFTEFANSMWEMSETDFSGIIDVANTIDATIVPDYPTAKKENEIQNVC